MSAVLTPVYLAEIVFQRYIHDSPSSSTSANGPSIYSALGHQSISSGRAAELGARYGCGIVIINHRFCNQRRVQKNNERFLVPSAEGFTAHVEIW